MLSSCVPSDCKQPHYYVCVPRDFRDLYCPDLLQEGSRRGRDRVTAPHQVRRSRQGTERFNNQPACSRTSQSGSECEEDLVFSADSPNFCTKNEQSGILGTQDRLCDKDSQGPDGCSVLCCGRGFYRRVYTIPVTRCQFVWCCRIECGVVGNQTIIEHRCN